MASDRVADYPRTVYFLSEVGVKTCFWAFSKEFSDKNSSETFSDYLIRSKPKWNETLLRKAFDKTSILKMKDDPTCRTFDITLLCAIFHRVTDGVSSFKFKDIQPLKDKMKELKDLRNTVLHGRPCIPMQEHIQNCQNCVFELIDCTSKTYDVSNKDTEAFINEITEQMEKVHRTPLTLDQLIQCSESYFKELACRGIEELTSAYRKWSKIRPVFFLPGWDFELKIDAVFTDFIVSDYGNIFYRRTEEVVALEDIFGSTKENLILVEGQAGAGKSTLLKYILTKWATGDSEAMTRLTDFDILIFFECRNSFVSSLEDLLSFLLPTVSKKFHHADLLKCIMDLEVLFLVDGLDEVNDVSMNVVRQIIYATNKPKVTALFTSRPTHVEKFYHLSHTSPARHLRLDGVPSMFKGEFVERLHRNLRTVDQQTENSESSVEKLVDYIENLPLSLQAHFKFPLNLTLVTILWIDIPDEMHKVSSMTTLYTQILALVKKKLCERLLLHKECEMLSSRELEQSVEIVYDAMCKKSFLDLKDNRYILDEAFLEQLRNLCSQICLLGKKISLPAEEVLGAFLTVKHTWTSGSCHLQYMYPHRSIQEHMAASYFCSYVMERMLRKEKNLLDLSKLTGKQKKFKSLLGSLSLNTGSQNFLLHLLGVMHSKGLGVLHEYSCYIVKYVSKRVEKWDVKLDWWLGLLKEVQADSRMVTMVAGHIWYKSWDLYDKDIDLSNMLLPYTSPVSVAVVINSFISQESLMKFASFCSKISSASFRLTYRYENPSQGNHNDVLQAILESGTRLEEFTGHLTKPVLVARLPNTLTCLEIVASSEEVYAALMKWPHLQQLSMIGLHIDAKLPLEILVPLPRKPIKTVFLSGVTDETLHWAVSAALLLQSFGYYSIHCHGCRSYSEHTGRVKVMDHVTKEGWFQMIGLLSQAVQGDFPLDPKLRSFNKICLNAREWSVIDSKGKPVVTDSSAVPTIPKVRGLPMIKLQYS